jgi:hypothetical protein
MKIKEKFELLPGTPNVTDIPKHTIKSMVKDANDASQIPTLLDLKKNSIKHFSKDTIYKYFRTNTNEKVHIVSMENYPLSVSYNRPTDSILINLKPTDTNELINMPIYDLYAALAYGYFFRLFIAGTEKISDDVAPPIINYLSSVFVRVFGKAYGLTETYSGAIPKLKFLLSCYIYASFFDYSTNADLFRRAIGVTPYNYMEDVEKLTQYDFSSIKDFVKVLSDSRVMSGLKVFGFTEKLYRFFGVNMLPGFEDLSRFICGIIGSSVKNQRLIPSFIYKYNEREFNKILRLVEKRF